MTIAAGMAFWAVLSHVSCYTSIGIGQANVVSSSVLRSSVRRISRRWNRAHMH